MYALRVLFRCEPSRHVRLGSGSSRRYALGERSFACAPEAAPDRGSLVDTQATHASLLSRVRDPSDSTAWREFESRYGELIVRYARARGLSFADALDVRQIVLLRLSRSLRGFHYDRERGRFRSYLGAVVRSVVFRWSSCPKPVTVSLDDGWQDIPDPAADDRGAEKLWEREWALHHVRMARARLQGVVEARSLEVFDRLLAGDSIQAVAAMFDASTEAVRKIKQRVRERMKELVAEQVREEEVPDERGADQSRE